MNEKVVFPIAKNRVVGACKVSDDAFDKLKNDIIANSSPKDLYLWTLTSDDYWVGINRFTNQLLVSGLFDQEYLCFICY